MCLACVMGRLLCLISFLEEDTCRQQKTVFWQGFVLFSNVFFYCAGSSALRKMGRGRWELTCRSLGSYTRPSHSRESPERWGSCWQGQEPAKALMFREVRHLTHTPCYVIRYDNTLQARRGWQTAGFHTGSFPQWQRLFPNLGVLTWSFVPMSSAPKGPSVRTLKSFPQSSNLRWYWGGSFHMVTADYRSASKTLPQGTRDRQEGCSNVATPETGAEVAPV